MTAAVIGGALVSAVGAAMKLPHAEEVQYSRLLASQKCQRTVRFAMPAGDDEWDEDRENFE